MVAQPGAGGSVELGGVASLAVRDLITGPRADGRVIAAFRGAILVEFPGSRTGPDSDPRVVAISAADAIRLPNAIIIAGVTSDVSKFVDVMTTWLVAQTTKKGAIPKETAQSQGLTTLQEQLVKY